MLVLGFGALFLGLYVRTLTQNEIAAMLPAEGRVVDIVSRTTTSGGERKTYFYPVVEFRTAGGESVRFEGSTGSNPSSYRVGDMVRVLYDPQTPQSALIDSWDLWLPSGIFIGVGGFFALMGILALLDALAVLLKWGGLLGLLGIILLRRKRT
jgi:hypothetical protein